MPNWSQRSSTALFVSPSSLASSWTRGFLGGEAVDPGSWTRGFLGGEAVDPGSWTRGFLGGEAVDPGSWTRGFLGGEAVDPGVDARVTRRDLRDVVGDEVAVDHRVAGVPSSGMRYRAANSSSP